MSCSAGLPASLDPVAADGMLALWREADVGHDRDAGRGQGGDLRRHRPAALELDRVGPALLHEPGGRLQRLLGAGLVGPERHVSDHERVLDAARDGADEHQHLLDGDRNRCLVGEDVVAGGVAHEQHRDAGLVENLGGVLLVRREHRPALAPLLHRLEPGDAHLLQRAGGAPAARDRSGPVRRGLLGLAARLAARALAHGVSDRSGLRLRTRALASGSSPAAGGRGRRPAARSSAPGRTGVASTRPGRPA